MSTTRKRSFVTVCPVLLVKRRRRMSVPNVLFAPVSELLRSRFGAVLVFTDGSTAEARIVALR